MIRFSANLGFLWTDRPLVEAVEMSASAGFDAVEVHAPYDTPPASLRSALEAAGLPIVSLNTRAGDSAIGEIGLAALPGRQAEARLLIDEAIDYAVAIGCPNVSVVAGRTGRTSEAEGVYRANLEYAAGRAAAAGRTILIEPLNRRVAVDYHLLSIDAGVETIAAVGADNLKLMVDCFHTQVSEGDLLHRITNAMPFIGHIQFSAVPDRGEPDRGEVDYRWLLPEIVAAGYDGFFGAEYTPRTSEAAGMSWKNAYQEDHHDQ